MNLMEVFDQLSQGEIKDLYMGGLEGNKIISDDYPRIIPHVNLALMELSKRFPIHTRTLYIEQHPDIKVYFIDPKYAESNIASVEPIKYIKDLDDPFKNNLIQIEEVIDEEGVRYSINDRNDCEGLSLPHHNGIRLKQDPVAGRMLEVVYRANHPKILLSEVAATLSHEDLANIDIDIPMAYMEPLILYIASRHFAGLPPTEGVKDSSVYLLQFEASCKKIAELGIRSTDNTLDKKLINNGWV